MPSPTDDVLFEFVRVGPAVKVTAVHAATGIEVVIQGPANQPTAALQRAALAKLRYVLEKKAKQ